jgi:hypothetical protein
MKTLRPILASLLFTASVAASTPFFEFGPGNNYTGQAHRPLDTRGAPLTWGGKRLFSETHPLTPPGLVPAIYGGFELYNASGNGIFIDYKGSPSTGVNDNTFGQERLDSVGVKSGFIIGGNPRDISFAVAFLALGRLDRPRPLSEGFAVTTRVSNRSIGQIPGSVRVVMRAGNTFYASEVDRVLRSSTDTSFVFTAAELSGSRWTRYNPFDTIAHDPDAVTSLPANATVDLAGVLITRVVNAQNAQRDDFATNEIAELRIVPPRR